MNSLYIYFIGACLGTFNAEFLFTAAFLSNGAKRTSDTCATGVSKK